MKRLAFSLATLALVLAGTASAGRVSYVYKLKPGYTQTRAERYITTQVLHSAGFSDVDCWLGDGNARVGWKHVNCVGTYTESGQAGRWKMIFTLVSCTHERRTLIVPGEPTDSDIYKIDPRKWRSLRCAVRNS